MNLSQEKNLAVVVFTAACAPLKFYLNRYNLFGSGSSGLGLTKLNWIPFCAGMVSRS